MPAAPFYRQADGRVELIVPRADGSVEVHPISFDLALLHLRELADAIRRHPDRPAITLGREPA